MLVDSSAMRSFLACLGFGVCAWALGGCSGGDDDDSGGPHGPGSGGLGQVGGSSGSGGTTGGTLSGAGGAGNTGSGGSNGGSGNSSGSGGSFGGTSGSNNGGAPPVPGTCADYAAKLASCSVMNASVDCSVAPGNDYLPCMYGCYAAAPCGQIVDGTCGEDASNPFVDCMLVCDALEFDCGGGQHVPAYFQCDTVPDCDNQSDEDGCPAAQSTFACNDGGTVPAGFRCDGFEDCEDASDEDGCPKITCPPPPVPPAGEACGKAAQTLESCGVLPGGSMTSCMDRTAQQACEKTCLADASCTDAVAFLCEGEEAESVVSCLEACQSESDSFPCADGTLVPSFFLCDDVNDCDDGSDEADCAFQCKRGGTVPYSSTCDGTDDCSDGSDEDGCGPTCEAP